MLRLSARRACGVCVGKDHGASWPNVIEMWSRVFAAPIATAIEHYIAQHDVLVARFDVCEAELLVQLPGDEWKERVQQWARLARYMCFGFARWHVECPRYMRKLRTDGNVAYRYDVQAQ